MIRNLGTAYQLRYVTQTAGANNWTSGAPSTSTINVRGREHRSETADIHGGLETNTTEITLEATGIATAPKKGDQIALTGSNDWRFIEAVDARREGAAVMIYVMQVRR